MARMTATGERLWEFTPDLDQTCGRVMCCGQITRGLAALGDNIYIATIDAQLIAVKGMIVLGNGGPNNAKLHGPDGGDNLFRASIVALDPDDSSYVCHSSRTPARAGTIPPPSR